MKEPQLRQDLVTGEWVIIAPGRFKRPKNFKIKKKKREATPIKDCPFEDPEKSGNKPIVYAYPDKKNWKIIAFPNKYPILKFGKLKKKIYKEGPYNFLPAFGYHELLVTRDHEKTFPDLNEKDSQLVFETVKKRYLEYKKDKSIEYAFMFHNWGELAGASIFHPHYQLSALPIIPPDIQHSLEGSERYFKENKKCVYCEMIKWEKKYKKRVIFENDNAIAFTRFASKEPFDIRIFPKKHYSCFEETENNVLNGTAEALEKSLKMIKNKLGDPDYNFYLHSGPFLDNNKKISHSDFYHWHIDVLPRMAKQAGMELGTGVEVTVVDPDEAASILKM